MSPVRKDVYPGDIVIKRIKGAPAWGEPQFRLGTVMNQSQSNSAYVNHNSKSFHVMWEQNSRVELSNTHQVGVVNRQVSRGTKVVGEDGQEGKVVGSKTLATVHIMGTTNVVEKVGTERLNPINKLVRGQQIMYKNWVGYIVNLKKNVHFILDGGMGFFIPSHEVDGFVRNDLYWGPGVTCPGMRSRISGRQMRNAVWTAKPLRLITRFFPSLNYLYSMTPCTVNKSEITELLVDWLQVAPGIGDPESVPKPPQIISADDIRDVIVVGEPSSEVLGYNSVRILRVKPEDSITTLQNWTDFFVRKFADSQDISEPERVPAETFDKLRAMASERPYEVAVKILNLHTMVDVEWNNGETTPIPSTKVASITPYDYQGDYPIGMIVTPLYKTPTDGDRYGVVQESGMSMRNEGKGRSGKLTVKWVTNDEELSDPEEVSSFDIRPHEAYSMYIRGSVVFPRSFGDMPFKSGYVVDMDVSAAKLVIVSPVDMEKHEVFPHKVVPFSTRVFWNFFQRKYLKDTILPPPYQLEVEFSPLRFFPEEVEPPANILAVDNNNPEGLPQTKQFSIWDEPSFDLMAFAPESHRYFNTMESSRGFGKEFSKMMEKEFNTLKQPGAVPEGIWIRSYENRMDLVSVLMVGPSQTLYEEGIYLFDLQLSPAFPKEAPRTHFVSYSMELNPLTSWDGNFCVSSLDWNFQLKEEKPVSFIANFVAQVQGKLFTKEPFFCDQNHAAGARTEGSIARARLYNEQTFIRVLDSTWNLIHFPHAPWENFIKSHFADTLPSKLAGIQSWDLTKAPSEHSDASTHPEYPLAPVCVGFMEALNKRLEKFKKIVPAISATPKHSARVSKPEVVFDETADSESTPVQSIAEPSVAGELKLELVEPVNANLKRSNLSEDEEVSIKEIPGKEAVRSRPGSPVHTFHVGEQETEIPLIPEVFKIPSRKNSSEHVASDHEGLPDETGSMSSGKSEKISAWPVKPQSPEDPTGSPDSDPIGSPDSDHAKHSGLLAHLRQPLDSLKNVIRSRSKSSSKNSSKSSKSKSKKQKKSKKKQKLLDGASPPESSVGSGSGGESDMDETDLDLTRRLTTAENRPSSPDDEESFAEDRLFTPEERPITPTSQNDGSGAEEIEAD